LTTEKDQRFSALADQHGLNHGFLSAAKPQPKEKSTTDYTDYTDKRIKVAFCKV